jgi:hypothetical protein
VYTRIKFATLSLPCFNELYLLFYPKGKKVIPFNINGLITPIGLAYLSQEDGAIHSSGFRLCTEAYTKNENLVLIKALKDKFNLDCSLHCRDKK